MMLEVLTLATAFVVVQPANPSPPSFEYDVARVRDGVYILKPVNHRGRWVTCNIEVIIGSEYVVVVDTGMLPSAGRAAIDKIKALTDRPVKYVVNTHWHGDHWQGNEAFAEAYPGVQFVATEEGRKGIVTFGMRDALTGFPETFRNRVPELEAAVRNGSFSDGVKLSDERLAIIKKALPGYRLDAAEIQHLKPVAPNVSFTERMTLSQPDRRIELLYLGFGNTTGDAVVYLPDQRVVISGDMVLQPSPYESGAFSREWLDAMKKLRDLRFDTLLPGHGEPQQGAAWLDFEIQLFATIIKQVNAAVLLDRSLEQTEREVTLEGVLREIGDKRFEEFKKAIDPSFVPACVLRAYPKAKEGKL